MNDANFIREGLNLHGIPVYEDDIPYIEFLLHTILQAQIELKKFPDLNDETPITIFDKELIR